MSSPLFINCFILGEYIFVFIAQLLSLYIFGRIFIQTFYKKVRVSVEISSSMILYIILQIFTSIFTLGYMVFLILGWSAFTTSYNAYWMYFWGAIQSHFFTLLPVAVISLGIDRCLCVLYPLRYSKQRYYYPIYLAFILMAILTALSLIYRIIPAFPAKPLTECYSFGCQTTTLGGQIYFYMRYFTGACILALSTALFIIIKLKMKTYFSLNREGRSNKLVISTLITTLILDFLPNLVAVIFYSIVGVNLTVYVGPYSTVISSLECAICALYYRKVFIKHITPNASSHHPNQASANLRTIS